MTSSYGVYQHICCIIAIFITLTLKYASCSLISGYVFLLIACGRMAMQENNQSQVHTHRGAETREIGQEAVLAPMSSNMHGAVAPHNGSMVITMGRYQGRLGAQGQGLVLGRSYVVMFGSTVMGQNSASVSCKLCSGSCVPCVMCHVCTGPYMWVGVRNSAIPQRRDAGQTPKCEAVCPGDCAGSPYSGP